MKHIVAGGILAAGVLNVQAAPARPAPSQSFPNSFNIAVVQGEKAAANPTGPAQEHHIEPRQIQSINAGSTLIVPVLGSGAETGPNTQGKGSENQHSKRQVTISFDTTPDVPGVQFNQVGSGEQLTQIDRDTLGVNGTPVLDIVGGELSSSIGTENSSQLVNFDSNANVNNNSNSNTNVNVNSNVNSNPVQQLADGQVQCAPCTPTAEVECPPCRPPIIGPIPPAPVQPEIIVQTETYVPQPETRTFTMPAPVHTVIAPAPVVTETVEAPTIRHTVTQELPAPTYTSYETPVVHVPVYETVYLPAETSTIIQPGPVVTQTLPAQEIIVTAPAPTRTVTDIVYNVSTQTVEAPRQTVWMEAVCQIRDGQIQGPACPPPAPPKYNSLPVQQIADGQIQLQNAPAFNTVQQIADGQVQLVQKRALVGEIPDGQIQAGVAFDTVEPVAQIADGQIQVAAAFDSVAQPVQQIADGQIQQIVDGQIQVPVQQIPDGQIQQIADGQVQVPVQQIADGQIQQIADGQVQVVSPVQQIPDGQIQQIADGQVQVPVQQIPDGQIQQIVDGQIQVPVQQIPDGQIQQIADGQIQVPVQQIPDGQIQQIADGQIQVPVQQIADGQIQQIADGQVQVPEAYKTETIVLPTITRHEEEVFPTVTETVHEQILLPAVTRTVYEKEYIAAYPTPSPMHKAERIERRPVEHKAEHVQRVERPVQHKIERPEVIEKPERKQRGYRKPARFAQTFISQPVRANGKASGSYSSSYTNSNGVEASAIAISKRDLSSLHPNTNLHGKDFAVLSKRQDPNTLPKSVLSLTLENGVLRDALGRIGYIASNYQFQFDNPPQAGWLIQDGFGICPETGRLTLRGSDTFWSCNSGDFSNLYDRYWAEHCEPVNIQIIDSGMASHAYVPTFSVPPTHAEIVNAQRAAAGLPVNRNPNEGYTLNSPQTFVGTGNAAVMDDAPEVSAAAFEPSDFEFTEFLNALNYVDVEPAYLQDYAGEPIISTNGLTSFAVRKA